MKINNGTLEVATTIVVFNTTADCLAAFQESVTWHVSNNITMETIPIGDEGFLIRQSDDPLSDILSISFVRDNVWAWLDFKDYHLETDAMMFFDEAYRIATIQDLKTQEFQICD